MYSIHARPECMVLSLEHHVKLISAVIIRNGNKRVSRTDGLFTTDAVLPRTFVLLPISRRQNADDVTIKIQF